MRTFLVVVLYFFLTTSFATDPYPRNEALDVLHYIFRLEFNDTTDRIAGVATVTIRFKKSTSAFQLDLVGKQINGRGMVVDKVLLDDVIIRHSHLGNRLQLFLSKPAEANQEKKFVIHYAGIPSDGLRITKNKFGDRTFFADNWPDRGRHWLPCIDHPSDKARVDFMVVAPQKYQVVASGKQIEETTLPRGLKLTHWEERVPIPVKVMAVGVGRFAVQQSADIDNIPQSTWVFPENRDEGFYDFEVGRDVFLFFHQRIGPYPYEKLAHVQSTTRWGALENASNIFYMEGAVTGSREHEALIAHETAHQWFGNSVTENDWHHVWLSEGFATYFAALYMEQAHGPDRLADIMKENRIEVISYLREKRTPIIDTTISDISAVLSTNTYQKAGWVLHMLRREVGEDLFWKGIQLYYTTFRDSNALTNDFRKVMEQVSGRDLAPFFHQWLYKVGHPQLKVDWSYDGATKQVRLAVRQLQKGPFLFPLDILLHHPDGRNEAKTVAITSGDQVLLIPADQKPESIVLDPGCRLLFEANLTAR